MFRASVNFFRSKNGAKQSPTLSTKRDFSENEIKAATNAAESAKPRVYTITGHLTNILRTLIFGCQGDKGEGQNKTAELMATIPHDYKIGCGDNFYENGVLSVNDERFYTQFHNLYDFSPSFMDLGNHDGNLHNKEKLKAYFSLFRTADAGKTGREVEVHQVAHTYLHQEPSFFEKLLLPFNKLTSWMMPSDYYAVINGKVQTFHLNMNSIAKDYLDYLTLLANGEEIDPNKNQIAWLILEFKKARDAGFMIQFAQHNPLFCYGKRAYEAGATPFESGWDANIYLESDVLSKLVFILKLEPNSEFIDLALKNEKEILAQITTLTNADYSWILREILFNRLGCVPDMVFSAHEHALHISHHTVTVNINGTPETRILCQVGSGGGGGKLQDRAFFGSREDLGLFAEANGFFITECDMNNPDVVYIHAHTLDGLHLKFTHLDPTPIRDKPIDAKAELLRSAVLKGIEAYQAFLADSQEINNGIFFSRNLKHKSCDAKIADDVRNYLNQVEALTFEATIAHIHNKFLNIYNKTSVHSLLYLVNKAIAEDFKDLSLDGLYNEVTYKPHSLHA